MKCKNCGKIIKGNPWIWSSDELCEDCFVEVAAKEYNQGYDKMIRDQGELRGDIRK